VISVGHVVAKMQHPHESVFNTLIVYFIIHYFVQLLAKLCVMSFISSLVCCIILYYIILYYIILYYIILYYIISLVRQIAPSLQFPLTRIMMKIFKTNSKEIVNNCQLYFDLQPISDAIKNGKSTTWTKFPPLATHCVNHLYRLLRLKW